MPALPTIALAVVTEEISAVPTGNPQSAAAVAPDAPCALPRHGRLQDRGGAGLEIDPTEIVAGKGSEKHLPLRRRGDAVGAGTARCIEHCHCARFGIETAINSILPGEPEYTLMIEGCCVQVRGAPLLRQREKLDGVGRRIHPSDRVLSAFSDPGGTGGADDHAVARCTRPQRDKIRLARC